MLKSYQWGVWGGLCGPHDFSVSPLGTNLGFALGWTGFGLDLGGSGSKGLGTGLDKNPDIYSYI